MSTAPADDVSHFTQELGFRLDALTPVSQGRATLTPELCVPGTGVPRASVLLTFADIACGIASARHVAPRIVVTVDLVVRLLEVPGQGPIEVESQLLKAGRTLQVAESRYAERGASRPFATAVATFSASPRPTDVLDAPPPAEHLGRGTAHPTLPVPLAERVGVQVVEPGRAEIEHRAEHSNSTSTLQGGLVALVGEVAAETLAEAELGAIAPAHELDVRYLRGARVGPAVARAELLHRDDSSATMRVEVRDAGADDRLVALVSARCMTDGSA